MTSRYALVMSLDGFLILDKPVGPSSAQLLNRVKRLLPRGTKIGHAGTLDPLASGVLVALLGKATKQSDRVMGMAKQYEATIRLGATSATDDAEGPIQERGRSGPPTTAHQMEIVLKSFIGSIEQMPPAFSAVKIGGRRACDRTRDGEVVTLTARIVRIDRIELLGFDWPDFSIRVDCGKGTYIRSLARDIGAAVGEGGYMSSLRRTRVGEFSIERAARQDALERDGVARWLLAIDE